MLHNHPYAQNEHELLQKPVTVQCVQLCSTGHLNFVIYQLNTLKLHDRAPNSIKNVAFIDSGLFLWDLVQNGFARKF